MFSLSLREPRKRSSDANGEPEIPWFWEALRSRVYSAMPHVEKRDLTLTFSPVIVTGTQDTIPGLGISGDF